MAWKHTKAFIINTDWTYSDMPSPEKEAGKFSLKQLQKAVGGYIEVVPKHPESELPDGWLALANEEGLLRDLKVNERASFALKQQLVGPVLIMREDQWD